MSTLYKGQDALKSAVAKLSGRKAEYIAEVQLLGASLMSHASEHGDVSLVPSYLDAVAKTSREAVWTWLRSFNPVTFDKETNTVKLRKGWKAEDFKLDAMQEISWDEFKKSKTAERKVMSAAAFLCEEKKRLIKIVSGQADNDSRFYTDDAKAAAQEFLDKFGGKFLLAESVAAGERNAKKLAK